jgi:carbon monoxide dehydrogenase subunit G
MASLQRKILIDVDPADAWAAIRDFARVQQLVPGFVIDCHLDGDARVVTFADGRVARELLVDIDDKSRRLVYAEPGGRFITRSASVQVFANDERGSRVVWIIDMLPNELARFIAANMDKAAAAMKRTLEHEGPGTPTRRQRGDL